MDTAVKTKSFDASILVVDLAIRDITKEVSLDIYFNGIAVNP